MVNLYQSRLAAAHIEVRAKFPRRPALIHARAGELRQVLANLVGNALDAMRSGGRLHIRLSTDSMGPKRKKRVRLTVADTGTGIPQEIVTRIFEPFVTTKGETGTGLGLWVTSELARKNGWTIRLRTRRSGEHNCGTVFAVIMPAAEGAGSRADQVAAF